MFGQYYISDTCVWSDHICEINYDTPIEENFKNPYSLNYYICMILVSILPLTICTWCFTYVFTKFWAYDWKVSRNFGSFMILFMIVYNLLIVIIPVKKEICSFPISCHEGINDTIVTTNYYYQMKECPDSDSWLTYDYSDIYDYNQDCKDSEWGCCTISEGITCSEFQDETYSYFNNIKDDYDGRWTFHIDKIDEHGSNCPSVEKMIYEVSVNDNNDYILLSFMMTSFSIVVLIIINICLICNRKQIYMQTDDIEDQELSPRKGVMIGSSNISIGGPLKGSA
jgi:hypothetical protein